MHTSIEVKNICIHFNWRPSLYVGVTFLENSIPRILEPVIYVVLKKDNFGLNFADNDGKKAVQSKPRQTNAALHILLGK
jgi:hypothetical protein